MKFNPNELRIGGFMKDMLESDLELFKEDNVECEWEVTDEYVEWMAGLHKFVEPKIIEEMNGYSDSEYEEIFDCYGSGVYKSAIEDTDMFVEHSNEYIKQNPNELFAEIMRKTVLVDLFIDIVS